jgi:hypothetical protein
MGGECCTVKGKHESNEFKRSSLINSVNKSRTNSKI